MTSKTASSGSPRHRWLAPIDPRIRARRVAVVREQGRRRLRFLVVAVAAMVLALLAWAVVHSPFLDVDHVDVIGARHAARSDVQQVARVRSGTPLLLVDLGAVARRVEQLPWVEHASVTRDLPGRLRITVTERVPAAWIRRAPDRVTLVDENGSVLVDASRPPDGAPELRGKWPTSSVPGSGHRLASLDGVRLLHELPDDFRRSVFAVTVERGEATVVLGYGLEVRLGRVEDVPAKVAAAQAVIAQLGTDAIRFVDVRVPGAPTTG